MQPSFLTPKIIEKSWGCEKILFNNDGFCGKYLIYNKAGDYSSFHFHPNKEEVFKILQGSFDFTYKDEEGHTIKKFIEIDDDIIYIPPCTPHQLKALEDNSIMLEISSHDDPNDVVRIEPSMPKN